VNGLRISCENICQEFHAEFDEYEWPIYLAASRTEAPENNEGSTIVEWWKGHKSRFPTLAKVALIFLFTPINSADVERSFSVYKNILSDNRHRLKQTNVAALNSLPVYVNL
jgi:hypothetical protein